MLREKQIEEKTKKAVEKLGGIFLKFTSPGTTGVPDRFVGMKGNKMYLVEFKKVGGVFSERQKFMAKEFLKRDILVYNVVDEKSRINFLQKLIDDQNDL